MEQVNIWLLAAVILLIVLIITVWIIQRRQMHILLDTLSVMVQDTIDGNLKESHYDETKLSALESKLYRYLAKASFVEKSLEAERNKIQALIADIAHQTKTPIANLMLYGQLLTEQELSEDSRRIAEQMNVYTEKLKFLIDSLMKTSRMENGIIRLAGSRQRILPMLEDVCCEAAANAEAKGISLNLAGQDCDALYDRKWTEEAIYNIVDNAVKYTGSGGQVTVEVVPYEQFCRINITDNGIGIDEAEITRIFKRFYRSPQVSGQEGVGIGLFLAREVINRQNGYIKVASEYKKGTQFSVFIPRKQILSESEGVYS